MALEISSSGFIYERIFTAETQSSEYFIIENSLLRVLRVSA